MNRQSKSAPKVVRAAEKSTSSPHAEALRLKTSQSRLLALQRTAGNQAVQRMLKSGTLLASSSLSAVIQRVVDLVKTYPASAKLSQELLNEWLPKFKQVQVLLNNKTLVDKHLQTLGAYMAQNKVSVSLALEHFQSGTWTGARPILTDFVSPTMFSSVVSKGQLFEDLVGESHGIQTHRIQWYIIGQELGNAQALQLYQEATNARWARYDPSAGSEKRMWDYIVDGLAGQANEFTTPDKLEAYLVSKAPYFSFGWSNLNYVGADISSGHNDQQTRQADMIKRYPPESEYNEALNNAIEQHKALIEQKNNATGFRAQNEFQVQANKIVSDIENERIVYTSNVEGEKKTFTFTGWITSEGSQAKRNYSSDLPYLIPSVAYPTGHNPDEHK